MGAGPAHPEGRLLRRDVPQAVELLGPWSDGIMTRAADRAAVVGKPGCSNGRPERLLNTTIEDAELGEPGAMDALISLKLSRNKQFADKTGGCALAERIAKAGDAAAARHLETCRAK